MRLAFSSSRLVALAVLGATLLSSRALAAAKVEPSASGANPRMEVPSYPNDLSVAGILAARSQAADPSIYDALLPMDVLNRVRDYVQETKALGMASRSGSFRVAGLTPNVNANVNHVGDAIGETQAEVAVAVYKDTVVIGFNDSRGFVTGNTISSYAYSTDGGNTFVDGGNIPLAVAGDQAFGDPGIDTDEKGNWYYCQIYTRAGPQQNIAVHNGTFTGGVLTWNSPTQASIGTAATGNLDKCLLAADRVTGNVYTVYTRFIGNTNIEIARSTDHGATWGAAIILDNGTTPTASKSGARAICGLNGEVYVVWEKGANTIFCNDAAGNIPNTQGQIAFTRSMNFGASYDPFSVAGTVDHGWTWSGPGDLRERGNEFPDIAVDRSNGPFRGNLYVTWNETAPWTVNNAGGTNVLETNGGATDAGNNNPGGATPFVAGSDNPTGTLNASDLDYWQFNATQGQSFFMELDPQGANCATALPGTTVSPTRNFRFRLYATQTTYPNPTGFPDTLLAASNIAGFIDRIVWTAPKTGSYLLRVSAGSSGTVTGTYAMRVRLLTFGSPNPARDGRDVVVVRSTNQGASWSAETRVNDDAAGLESLRPFISTDSKGRVAIFWHDHRDAGLGANGALTSIYGTLSRDGGATWSPNFETTDELSFFSFNTLAVPNLGDYNQSAGYGDVMHPAWSDQRLSTGDVRVAGTNTYSAGLGPEVYTTGIRWSASLSCPGDQVVTVGQAMSLSYTIMNTGNVAESYAWTFTDPQGWAGGNASGSTAVLAPGGSQTVTRNGTVAAGACSDAITFSAAAPGDLVGGQTCNTTLSIAPHTITASAGSGGSIAPSGAVSVACGANQSFTITPNAGLSVVNVVVDGVSVGTPTTYTFTNVQANHTIAASFGVAGVKVALLPATQVVTPGNEFDLSIEVTRAGSAFNGFDMIVSYDPAQLTLMPLSPISQQEGSYFAGACATRTHVFLQGADRDTIRDLLLCPGVSLTGPGQIYKLHFRASASLQVTTVRFQPVPQFSNGGVPVNPDSSSDATIGPPSALGVNPGPLKPSELRISASPNPARGTVSFRIDTDREGAQRLIVADIQGRIVRRLQMGDFAAGTRTVTWDGTNESGFPARPGNYVAMLRTSSRTVRARFMLLQ